MSESRGEEVTATQPEKRHYADLALLNVKETPRTKATFARKSKLTSLTSPDSILAIEGCLV